MSKSSFKFNCIIAATFFRVFKFSGQQLKVGALIGVGNKDSSK